MYTLKGIFPEPKKEQKKNFIKENMKQLKYLQGKVKVKVVKDPKFTVKSGQPPRMNPGLSPTDSLARFKPLLSKSGKSSQILTKSGKNKKHTDLQLRKGDMAEFLKRKEQRQQKHPVEVETSDQEIQSVSSGNLRDIACQTLESTLAQKFAECTKLTVLYPKNDEDAEAKQKASGDTARHRNQRSPNRQRMAQLSGDSELFEPEKRSRLNSILERKDKDNKDPYLPSGTGYQKGVVPKYLRDRKEPAEGAAAEGGAGQCPPGHVTLPDVERKETLRMLRSSFAELVNELNKMPVKTDTLRMRNRKMELEKQLAKLEEGIKVFSRPKVFVKIGE